MTDGAVWGCGATRSWLWAREGERVLARDPSLCQSTARRSNSASSWRYSSPMEEYVNESASSAYHDRLPIGESVSAQPLVESPFFGFEGDIAMAALEPMLVPERPRGGELDAAECFHCTRGVAE